jgi:hypothetical protein
MGSKKTKIHIQYVVFVVFILFLIVLWRLLYKLITLIVFWSKTIEILVLKRILRVKI